MENVTWPAKYVQRGAIVVDTPSDVLRELADNNIFKMERKPEPVQQTLEDYFNEENKKSTTKKNVHWLDPVSV